MPGPERTEHRELPALPSLGSCLSGGLGTGLDTVASRPCSPHRLGSCEPWGRQAPEKGMPHLWVVIPQPHGHKVAVHWEQLQSKLVLGHHGVHTVLQMLQVELHRLAEGLHGYHRERVSPEGQKAGQRLPRRLSRRKRDPRTSAASRVLGWLKAPRKTPPHPSLSVLPASHGPLILTPYACV